MRTIMVSVCASVRPNTPREMIQNRAARRIFTFFAITSPVGLRFEFWKDWLNPQSMLIPIYFICFECSLLKASKAVKTTFRPVCVRGAVLIRPPESRKKIRPFEITSSKKWLKFFFWYDQDRLVITNLPVFLKLLYKVCSQSYHDVIIKKPY